MNFIDHFKTKAGLAHGFNITAWLVMALLLLVSPMSVDFGSFTSAFLLVGLIALMACICIWKNLIQLFFYFEIVFLATLLTIPILVSTYLSMSFNMPLADARLIEWDAAFGFNWREYIFFINQSPVLEILLHIGYSSFGAQLLLVPLLLVYVGQRERAYAFLFGYALLCFISSIVSIWFPANAAFVTFNVIANDVPNIHSYFGFEFLNEFNAVRQNPNFILNAQTASGILTFPSVHAGIAGFCIWAAWSHKILRAVFLVLNCFMFASAISHGAHYLVDVLAGGVIAIATAVIVSKLFLSSNKKRSVPQAENPISVPAA